MFDMGAKTIVEKILPVIDNFERGLAAVPDDKKDDPLSQVWIRSTSRCSQSLMLQV